MIDLNYLYIGLLKIGELGLAEPSQDRTNYRRVEMGPGDWELIKGEYLTNAVPINFPVANEFAWGLITHFGIFTSLNGKKDADDNLLAIGPLNESVIIYDGNVTEFHIGNLSISLGALGVYDV